MSTANPQDFVPSSASRSRQDNVLAQVLSVVGSLKVTCVLFLLGIFIILVGSLAQARRDVWQVVNQYFRVYIAEVEVRDFFPPSMFPQWINVDWDASLGAFASFPFPGGWLIGWLLLINLLAAHAAHIRIQAKGTALIGGIITTLMGLVMMGLIVMSGNLQTGVESANTLLSPAQIWNVLLGALLLTTVIMAASAFRGSNRAEKMVLLGTAAALGVVLIYFLISGPVNLSSMRILWQLMKACVCSAVLLVGCQLLFKKRGGIVLLHFGVALLMISELVVGLYGRESLMTMTEGESVAFARDVREVELAIVRTQDDKDTVVAVPQSLLEESAAAVQDKRPDDAVISLTDHNIPFDLRVTEYQQNSQLRSAEPGDTLTDSGTGSFAVAVPLDPVDGMNSEMDMGSAYVELIDRSSGEVLHSLLTSLNVGEARGMLLPERVTVNEQTWDLALRFRRNYRPYEVTLVDVQRDTYVGTTTPRNYQSQIVIRDHDTGQSEEFTLWMNNPLRYRGETFYQSGYNELPDGQESTTLQLVRNSGWMLPYIGCVVVSFGMFAQFWITLRRFLGRTSRASSSASDSTDATASGENSLAIPAVVALLCLLWVGSKLRSPKPVPDAMNLYEFAQLPVAAGGRSQPVDSYARNELLMTSHKSTFQGELTASELDAARDDLLETIRERWPDVDFKELETFSGEYEEWISEIARLTSSGDDAVESRIRDQMVARMSAVRWFLDMVARPDRAVRHRFVRIDNDQVLALLGLEQREGLVYSPSEIEENFANLTEIDKEARKLMAANQDNRLTSTQRRVMALINTMRRLDTMQQVFRPAAQDALLPTLIEAWRITKRLEGAPVPMGVATGDEDDQTAWETVRVASLIMSLRKEMTEAGLASREDLQTWVQDKLPEQTLRRSLESNFGLLKQAAEQQAEGKPLAPDAPHELAKKLVDAVDPGFDRELFTLIAQADPAQPITSVLDGMDDESIRSIASKKISQTLFEVLQTLENQPGEKRLAGVRTRLRQINPTDEKAVRDAMTSELLTIVLDDLDQRAAKLLYPSGDDAAFVASATGMLQALESWGTRDVAAFNDQVGRYRTFLAENQVSHIDDDTLRLETFFNRIEPFWKSIYLYLIAMLLSFVSWILWPRQLRNTAFAMILVGFVVHTAALWMRMEISGRPPVTSLYSSAIFIGWAMVGAALVIERMIGYGIGNIVAAVAGSASLVIAHYLARDEGDTFSVMQAVLDTTFWLATHVVCIALGYGATFLAGFLGLCYVVVRIRSTQSEQPQEVEFLGKVVYGVLCFALFFSLVGTVLGGLWADDSWGRFWGWDPKENGALIIVLWNALILHARWDKMVRDYGTAVLAMAGNIVTAWSWFGVNELKAGLHSYGFTEGRLSMLLGFIAIQTVIILAAAFLKPRSRAAA